MQNTSLYSSLRWRRVRARAIARDESRCTVSRLLGGPCSAGPLHAHHIVPVSEGGAAYDIENVGTACARHHPQWEALRRTLIGRREPAPPPRCPHRHTTPEGRAMCERRMARARGLSAA